MGYGRQCPRRPRLFNAERRISTVAEGLEKLPVSNVALLGFDHAVLGGHVLDAWKLPSSVAEVVAWHHQPGRAFEHGGELGIGVALVRIANRIDYQLRVKPELDEAFIAELAQDGSVQYTGYQAQILTAMWPKLRDAAQQMLSAIGG